ncbi:MAG TPA: hypothetical protein VFV86_08725 [Nitrososphaeraceae archaeon]|nr:hypothetical protein [Nitrososphaeraceae archaeon]
MIDKNIHLVQPYKVGTKTKKSLAMIIPSKIVKSHKIEPSTIFIIRSDENKDKIILEMIDISSKKVVASVDKSSEASSQQISTTQTT